MRAYTDAMADLPGRGAAILVVDDDALVRTVLRMALVAEGHTVLEAADVAQITALEPSIRLHLAVLDIHLPDGTVHDSLDALAARTPPPPVLLLSGDDRAVPEVAARAAGLARKPIELDELRTLVRRLLTAADDPRGPSEGSGA